MLRNTWTSAREGIDLELENSRVEEEEEAIDDASVAVHSSPVHVTEYDGSHGSNDKIEDNKEMGDQNGCNEESAENDLRESMKLRHEPVFQIGRSDEQALGSDEFSNMSITKDVFLCDTSIHSQAVCDEEIVELGATKRVLSAANKEYS